MSVKYYRYVTPSVIASSEAMGWIDLGPSTGHHGYWSNTMCYTGPCEDDNPPELGKETASDQPDRKHG